MRLRDEVPDLPKPMAPINGRPFLEYLIKNLIDNGIEKIILSVGYKAEKIIEYFGDQCFGVPIEYSIENKPLGTGGAIKLAVSLIKENMFLVVNGDTFTCVDLRKCYKSLKLQNNSIGMIAIEVAERSRYGSISIQNVTNLVLSFGEKGEMGPGIINCGLYFFSKELVDSWPKIDAPLSLEGDILSKCVKKNIFATVSDGYFIDIGIPADYKKAIFDIPNIVKI